ncbi:MAG: hypothetical protein ACC661_11120 [Verrucomicrobiales bacterium]
MDIQVATLCDSAADYGAKLCILGAFDTICSPKFPAVHPHCAIALRLCFIPEDNGETRLNISVIDEDGKGIIPSIEPVIQVEVPHDSFFMTRNLVLNLQGMSFPRAGQYSVDIRCNNEIARRIPLRVVGVDELRKGSGTS